MKGEGMPTRESPHFVKTSFAGALSLGLEPGRFAREAKCTCLNLLLTYEGGCRAACSYCGLAGKEKKNSSNTFIRVKWPVYSLEEILSRVQIGPHDFKRVCVSMVTHENSLDHALSVIRECRKRTGLPVSGLLCPTAMRGKTDLQAVKNAGADRVGIAVDAATRELFEKHRGRGVGGPHSWDVFWNTMAMAAEGFGDYRVGVHLIVGLGETEEEMVAAIFRAHEAGALTHLFSLFPEAGSLIEKSTQPSLGKYRRVQLARFLINEGIVTKESIRFSAKGRIVDFGIDVKPYVNGGIPFMTSGCPGEDGALACNRPFANERPSAPMRNFPFAPSRDDVQAICRQIWED